MHKLLSLTLSKAISHAYFTQTLSKSASGKPLPCSLVDHLARKKLEIYSHGPCNLAENFTDYSPNGLYSDLRNYRKIIIN